MVYDQAIAKSVLACGGNGFGDHDDQKTWTWDGTTWANVSTTPNP